MSLSALGVKIVALAASLSVMGTAGFGFNVQYQEQQERIAAETAHQAQVNSAVLDRSQAIGALNNTVRESQATVSGIGQEVMDKDLLTEFAETTDKALSSEDTEDGSSSDVTTIRLSTLSVRAASYSVKASAQKVVDSHAAWQKEQERLEAERKAAEEAARKAAEEAAAAARAAAAAEKTTATQSYSSSSTSRSASSSSSGSTQSSQSQQASSAPAGADYTLNVSGYCGDGGQCAQSSVDSNPLAYIVYPNNGLSEIAGHNYGSAYVIASFRPGTTVRVYGNGAGLYRVNSLVYVSKNVTAADVPSGFAFQTCVGSQMVLAYASKIG